MRSRPLPLLTGGAERSMGRLRICDDLITKLKREQVFSGIHVAGTMFASSRSSDVSQTVKITHSLGCLQDEMLDYYL
jgi:hypothetical protein